VKWWSVESFFYFPFLSFIPLIQSKAMFPNYYYTYAACSCFFLHTKTERSIEILFHCPRILKNSNSLIIDEAVKETINIVITLQLIWKYFFQRKCPWSFFLSCLGIGCWKFSFQQRLGSSHPLRSFSFKLRNMWTSFNGLKG
jgi:hypothetical protein